MLNQETSTTTTTTNATALPTTTKPGHVSPRGAANIGLPMNYLAHHFQSLADPYDFETNPHGYITMCVAENKLAVDVLQQRLLQLSEAGVGFSTQAFGYDNPIGLPVLRQAVAQFLQRCFFKVPPVLPSTQHNDDNDNSSQLEIHPDHIAIGAGASGLLSHLAFCLGQPGDAILIPAPYYAAFDNDMRALAGCVTVPVTCADPTQGPCREDLERAKHEAEQRGLHVRFLLLTNPHNPLGVIYAPRVLHDSIAWARSHALEIIVDEIYAMSVFDNNNNDNSKPKFESIIQLSNNQLGHNVHVIWGFSKDFGASGFRVGILYSQNELLLQAIGNINAFSWVSHPMQLLLADLLHDHAFVEEYLHISRQRLHASYTICTHVLQDLNIPYVPAQAGMFVYIDLSSIIATTHQEVLMSDILMTRAHMVLTPGTTQHDPTPGKFRICYAYVPPETLQVAMERFRKLVTVIREQGGLDGDWVHDDSYWNGILD